MSTQNALVVTSVGQPVEATTRPIPQPGPKHIHVRVTVAALNPHDRKSRDLGLLIKDHLPAVIANDIVGVVTALGPGVTAFKVGDRVFGQGKYLPDSSQQGLQEFVTLEEEFTGKIPDDVSDHDAATIPTNIMASVVGLWHESGLQIPAPWTEEAKTFDYAATALLIVGGGSNCGRFAVQVAKLTGIGKIVVVGGNEEQLKKFGATHVLDRHGGHDVVLKRIRDVVGDNLIYAYDAVNDNQGQLLAANALSNTKRGTLARLVFLEGPLDASGAQGKKAGFEVKNVFGSAHEKPEVCAPFWARVEEYLKQRKITPLSYEVVNGLDAVKANEVLDKYRDGKPVTQTHFRISN